MERAQPAPEVAVAKEEVPGDSTSTVLKAQFRVNASHDFGHLPSADVVRGGYFLYGPGIEVVCFVAVAPAFGLWFDERHP